MTSLSRSRRLRLTKQFLAVYRRGAWVRGRILSIGVIPNQLEVTRVGLRTSKHLRGSVIRNRMKRRLREAYRNHAERVIPGRDVLIVIKLTTPLSELDQELTTALKKSGLLSR